MRIKPVLVPDHDAAELRGLMDRFAEAATGPVKRQLTESVESDVAEGVADTKQLLQAYAGLYYNSRESAGNDMDYDTIQKEMDQIEQQIAKQYGPAGVKKLQKYGYEQYHGRGSFDDDVVREAGVAEVTMSRAAKGYEKYGKEGMAALAKAGREGRALDPVRDRYNRYDETAEAGVTEARPDVMRHRSDTTVKVVKRGGKPIGEIGIDAEASSGNGPYYVKLYDGSYDAVGFDTAEEALAELRYAISEGLAEGVDPIEQLRADIRRFAQ